MRGQRVIKFWIRPRRSAYWRRVYDSNNSITTRVKWIDRTQNMHRFIRIIADYYYFFIFFHEVIIRRVKHVVPQRTAPVLRLSESETLLMLRSAAAGSWLGNSYRVFTRTTTIKYPHDNTLSRPKPTVCSKIVRMITSIFQ